MISRTESLVNYTQSFWISSPRPLAEGGWGDWVISPRSSACFVPLYGDIREENISPGKMLAKKLFSFLQPGPEPIEVANC